MDKYTVYQVADLLNVSHTTIYKKINDKTISKQLKNFINRSGKSTFIDSKGVDILKTHIQTKETVINNLESDSNADYKPEFTNEHESANKTDDNNVTYLFTKTVETFIKSLESNNNQIINSLEKQIENLTKDKEEIYKQLSVKDNQILYLNEQIKANQVLLADEKQKSLLMQQEIKAIPANVSPVKMSFIEKVKFVLGKQ